MNARLLKITCSCRDANEGAMLVGSPAEILSDTSFVTYFSGDEKALADFTCRLNKLEIEIISANEFQNENWVQLCEDIWKPIAVGELVLKPILGTGRDCTSGTKEILIIPGTGFGTGHHESTRLALRLLQHPLVEKQSPRTALDVGTGNGILALGAAVLYGTRVTAIDNDPLAIINAKENIEINSLNKLIQLQECTVEVLSGRYDLILSNIYAEVLCSLETEFAARAKLGSSLILAGITAEKGEMIEKKFSAGWQLIEKQVEGDWLGFLFSNSEASA